VLATVSSGNALSLLLKSIAARWGRPNGIFAWDHGAIYQVALEDHHRTLSDARATSQFLNLVNLKRDAEKVPDLEEQAA
jgi:hypothetical protein